jgi:hypothetical protein
VLALTTALALTLTASGTSATRCPTSGANSTTPARGMLGGLFGNGRMAASAYRVIKVTPRTQNADGSIGEKF